jgi:flagellar P-ring protein precursor FlgI
MPTMMTRAILALTAAVIVATSASATSLQQIARLEEQGESVLQGLGLVVGLPGTGDSAEDLIVARPLFAMLEAMGNAPGSLEELAEANSAALVVVTCTIPEGGARVNDRFDVTVSAINNAESLAGGELFLTPLRGPLPGQGVYAIAQGSLLIEGINPVRATVRGGAKMIQQTPGWRLGPDGMIKLVIRPSFGGWTTAQLVSDTINQHRVGFTETAIEIARAVDDRTVEVRVPEAERGAPANFLADILSIRFDPSLLDLPARVVVNEREGVIIAAGGARFSPVSISAPGVMISTLAGETDEEPRPGAVGSAQVPSDDEEGVTGSVEDLLAAMRQLNLPVGEQISIIHQLDRAGALHAELVID